MKQTQFNPMARIFPITATRFVHFIVEDEGTATGKAGKASGKTVEKRLAEKKAECKGLCREADHLLTERKGVEAAAIYEKARKFDLSSLHAHFGLAHSWFVLDKDGALPELEKVAKRLDRKKDGLEKLLKEFCEYSHHDPEDDLEAIRSMARQAHHDLAVIYYARKDYGKARGHAKASLLLDDGTRGTCSLLARIEYELGDYSSSIRHSTLALENYSQAEVYIIRAQAYFKQKEYGLAFSDCNEAIPKINSFTDGKHIPYALRGQILLMRHEFALAKEDIDMWIGLEEPKNIDALVLRGILKLTLQDFEGALEDSKEARKLDSKNQDAIHIVGCACLGLNRFAEAEKYFKMVLELGHPLAQRALECAQSNNLDLTLFQAFFGKLSMN